MAYFHIAAPTQYVDANGVKYAYRRFGAETGAPLVFLQHFRGGMDHWDPAVTDGWPRGGLSSFSTMQASLAQAEKRPTRSTRWHGARVIS